jgi:hypothetical protein
MKYQSFPLSLSCTALRVAFDFLLFFRNTVANIPTWKSQSVLFALAFEKSMVRS